MKLKLYFIVYKTKSNTYWEYVLDSQLRPTMYRSIDQLKKYLYKFKNTEDKEYRVVEYKLNTTAIPLDDINILNFL